MFAGCSGGDATSDPNNPTTEATPVPTQVPTIPINVFHDPQDGVSCYYFVNSANTLSCLITGSPTP